MMNKNLWIVVAVVIVVAGIWWSRQNGSDYGWNSENVSPSPTAVASPVKTKAATAPSTISTSGKTYSQLVSEFGSFRFQFDQACQAQPKQMALKNGASILLDNRANETRTITFNGNTYKLGPYGYQVVVVSGTNLPKNIGINCNSSVNVGTIVLQAMIGQ